MSAPAFVADFRRASRREPCSVCEKPDGCAVRIRDGAVACRSVESDRPLRTAPPTWLHGGDAGHDWRDGLQSPRAQSDSIMDSPPDPDPDIRDRGLRSILAACPLSPDHRQHLRDRGLADTEIDGLPVGSLLDRDATAAAVVADLGESAYGNVPGLYRGRGHPRLSSHAGLVIGVLHAYRLVGLVVRPDDEAIRSDGKYRPLSSGNRDGGCASGAPCAVLTGEDDEAGSAIIVEGILKGLIVNVRTGLPVVAIPGAGITSAVVGHLGDLGATTALLAYDGDRLTNAMVAGAEATLIAALDAAGFPTFRLTWPSRFKGLDDALLAGRIPIAGPVERPARAAGETPERVATAERQARDAEDRRARLTRAVQATGLAAPEKQSLIALFTHIDAVQHDDPTALEFVIPNSHISEHVGVSPQTAGRHLDACQRLADGATGEIVELYDRNTARDPNTRLPMTVYRPRVALDDVLDFLPRAVPLAKDGAPKSKRGHGGPGRRFCPDHPDAKIVKRVTYHCAECDRVVDREPDSGITPCAPSDSIMESPPGDDNDRDDAGPSENDAPLVSVTSTSKTESGQTRASPARLAAMPGGYADAWQRAAEPPPDRYTAPPPGAKQ